MRRKREEVLGVRENGTIRNNLSKFVWLVFSVEKENQNPTLLRTYPVLGRGCQSRFLESTADHRQPTSGEFARHLDVRLHAELTTVAHHVDNEAEHGFGCGGVPLVLKLCGQVERYTTNTSKVSV